MTQHGNPVPGETHLRILPFHALLGCTLLAAMLTVSGTSRAENNLTYSIGLESRSTYTQWYEYPGIYFEEDFRLQGLRGEILARVSTRDNMTFRLGGSGALYFAGSYENGFGGEADAKGLRLSGIAQTDIRIAPRVDLLFRAELAYLVAIGDDIDYDPAHVDGVGNYLLTLDGGLGLRVSGFGMGALDSASLMYGFTLAGLSVTTDTYVRNDPVDEDWSNSSLMLMLNFGLR